MEYVLQTDALTKRYGQVNVVDEVSMHVKKGSIYGFIGKNGAGKTTFMRMVAGLAAPTAGGMTLFGSGELEQARRRIGTLIEEPGAYGGMTARENLEVLRRSFGITEKKRVEEMLALTGLLDSGKKKVKNFSMGMRQRLGIAISLMRNPDFLILDEPMNGLDPAGIREMRELLLKLNREKQITVLISSHILDELSRIATHYGIIRGGRLIEELGATDLEKRCHRCLKLVVEHPERAAAALEELSIENYDVPEPGVFRVFERLEDTAGINEALVRKGVSLKESYLAGQDLEGYFMELVGEQRMPGSARRPYVHKNQEEELGVK